MKLPRFLLATISLASLAGSLGAEEKNGVSLTVQRKTLDRADQRGGYYYSDRIDRTQGLKATIKNGSFKELPEGEVEWTILVRKYSSSSIYKYDGKEKVKALKPAESVEMLVGSAQILGWRDSGETAKDKIEHQVIVSHAGKETVRTASAANFDLLAKRAIKQVAPAAQ